MVGHLSRSLYVGVQPAGWVWAAPETHVMVLGPPRSGKTACVVIPNVLAAQGPVVSTSTKADVMQATLDTRSAMGRCWLFDPFNEFAAPKGVTRLRWSPVTACADWTVAQLMCADLVNAAGVGAGASDPHWRARAVATLGTLMHAAAVGGTGIDVVSEWVNRRELRQAEAMIARSGDPLAGHVMAGLIRTEAREMSGIFSTTADAVAAYRCRPALEAAREPNLAPGAFVASTDTIYVCSSTRVQDLVAPSVVMLVGAICEAAYARTRALGTGSCEAVADAHPLLLALDEAAGIAPLRDLPGILAEGASQGVQVMACFQDLSQARARWGTDVADGFLTLFGGKLVLPGIAHRPTLETISMLCGERDVPVRTFSRTHQGRGSGRRGVGGTSVTAAVGTRHQSRLTPAEVSMGAPGHALYIEAGTAPGWVRMVRWKEVPEVALSLATPTRDRSRLRDRSGRGFELG